MKLFLIAFFLPFVSCGQRNDSLPFTEQNFVKINQGADSLYQYVITYANKNDSSNKMMDTYFDSNNTIKMSRHVYRNGVLDGPYWTYLNGQISMEGTYQNGVRSGIRLQYKNGKISQKAFFKNGIKTGVWEDYNLKGEPVRKIFYDEKGNLIKEIELNGSNR